MYTLDLCILSCTTILVVVTFSVTTYIDCYADDVALLAPSPFALRNMLDTCSKFADQHHLCFNADKTQLINFSKTSHPVNSTPHFIFLGKPLPVSRSIKHLRHILTSNLSEDEDITAISKDMCRKANHLLHIFSCCDPSVKTIIFFNFLSISLRCCSLESFLPAAQST